jgi:tetratricopeptide (TPR) repeat protein
VPFFRRKDEGDPPPGDDAAPAPGFQPQPEKARKWFDHARTAAESTNYAYALHCFGMGIRLDPEAMSAHEEMYKAALQYAAGGGKGASGREIKQIDDATPVGRFAAAEFAWAKEINHAGLALKALEAAIKAEQREWGHSVAGRVLALLRRSKKLSKSQLLAARDLFSQVSAWNEAIAAGEMALALDPRDAVLETELKNLSAQRAMDQGGYEQAGTEGGFRKFVRDPEKQRELDEADAISGARTIEDRKLARAAAAHQENPRSADALNEYAQLIKKQGTPEALEQAHGIYMKGFQEIGEYRFRMAAGDIRIEQARARVKAIDGRIRSNGESPSLRADLDAARRALSELEATECRERVERYPTDRPLRYQLGVLEFDQGRYEQAMECFQKAKDEPKLRVRAGHMLGRCFAREGWHGDAILEFREALDSVDEEERELEIRYDLMLSLMAHARQEQSTDLAREARDMCSAIARKDIGFRDIRERRKEVEELVKAMG